MKENFDDAEQYCKEKAFGGSLVVIDGKELNDAIAGKLRATKESNSIAVIDLQGLL